jgi:hypothetical protein
VLVLVIVFFLLRFAKKQSITITSTVISEYEHEVRFNIASQQNNAFCSHHLASKIYRFPSKFGGVAPEAPGRLGYNTLLSWLGYKGAPAPFQIS